VKSLVNSSENKDLYDSINEIEAIHNQLCNPFISQVRRKGYMPDDAELVSLLLSENIEDIPAIYNSLQNKLAVDIEKLRIEAVRIVRDMLLRNENSDLIKEKLQVIGVDYSLVVS
jgi:hypothetical protein